MALTVKEVFRSLQGEGPAIGKPATFIRLSGCNLQCSFCDTVHEGGNEVFLGKLMEQVQAGPARVVITGGEPLLAGEELVELARAITATGRSADIETNGTMAPPAGLAALIDNYVISPKLGNSGNSRESRRLAHDLPYGPLKFVVASVEDLDEVEQTVALYPGRDVIIMPMGTDRDAMLRKMNELRGAVEENGWRLLPRLQVLLDIR